MPEARGGGGEGGENGARRRPFFGRTGLNWPSSTRIYLRPLWLVDLKFKRETIGGRCDGGDPHPLAPNPEQIRRAKARSLVSSALLGTSSQGRSSRGKKEKETRPDPPLPQLLQHLPSHPSLTPRDLSARPSIRPSSDPPFEPKNPHHQVSSIYSPTTLGQQAARPHTASSQTHTSRAPFSPSSGQSLLETAHRLAALKSAPISPSCGTQEQTLLLSVARQLASRDYLPLSFTPHECFTLSSEARRVSIEFTPAPIKDAVCPLDPHNLKSLRNPRLECGTSAFISTVRSLY
ncbi:hypothetical protein DFH27DRAFT_607221 [Peziza echinospora]|nr:hypothetical protein DFH27DRAFT_607221 [Peziza echinospora]